MDLRLLTTAKGVVANLLIVVNVIRHVMRHVIRRPHSLEDPLVRLRPPGENERLIRRLIDRSSVSELSQEDLESLHPVTLDQLFNHDAHRVSGGNESSEDPAEGPQEMGEPLHMDRRGHSVEWWIARWAGQRSSRPPRNPTHHPPTRPE